MAASPSKSRFRSVWRGLWIILILSACLLVAYLLRSPGPPDQEITFKHATPQLSPVASPPSRPAIWLAKIREMLRNLKPLPSENIFSSQTTPQLEQSVEFWYQKLLLRYPQLAIPMQTVPDSENGFLQLINYVERTELAGEAHSVPFPEPLNKYFKQKGPWDGEAAAKWMTANRARVSEIHSIGLLPGRSIKGISGQRQASLRLSLCLQFGNTLLLEARLAAERGDATAALEAVRAFKDLFQNVVGIEASSIVFFMIKTLQQQNLNRVVFEEIIPALPADQVDLAAWENTLDCPPKQPAEYVQAIKGEWNQDTRCFMLPLILNPKFSDSYPDRGELLDFCALHTQEFCRVLETATSVDWPTLQALPPRCVKHLSAASLEAIKFLPSISATWIKELRRIESINAMTRNAFAIMKGQPISKDPIYGLNYGWDPATRQLSFPAGTPKDLEIPSITVPKIGSIAAP